MMALVAMLLTGALFLGPLGWRIRLDRQRACADTIKAEVRAAVNQRLRGESLVSVLVTPRALRRRGQIVLCVPSSYEWLVEAAWRDVVRRLPPGYDLVMRVRDAGASRSPRHAEGRKLLRAA